MWASQNKWTKSSVWQVYASKLHEQLVLGYSHETAAGNMSTVINMLPSHSSCTINDDLYMSASHGNCTMDAELQATDFHSTWTLNAGEFFGV